MGNRVDSSYPLRLAVWSGPRNISTAMMRSWGNRPDTLVCDEPLYAHYLSVTRKPHPGIDEVIAAGPTDLQAAIAALFAPLPPGKSIFYQKHMTHHLLPGMDLNWVRGLVNCFLIRDPAQVVVSFAKKVAEPTLEDLGYPQQAELFDRVCQWTGTAPPVLDAADVLGNPAGMLGRLCERVGVDFDSRMLQWPPGPRDTDGVWAKYWYKEVEATTGFGSPRLRSEPVPPNLQKLVDAAEVHYHRLHRHRLAD